MGCRTGIQKLNPYYYERNGKGVFLSSCAIKSCFRAIGIRYIFIFSDILSESQRRAYDKDCNM